MLFVTWGGGVVTLMAGPLEPLTGVLSQIIIKAAPFDLRLLPFEIRARPLCILKESGLAMFVCRGLKERKLNRGGIVVIIFLK